MNKSALIDSDVIIKLCCYDCCFMLQAAVKQCPVAMLSVGRYALRNRIKRTRTIVQRERVAAALEGIFAEIQLLQPNEEELKFSTELEEQAARLSLDLDTGESQLLAMALGRETPLLITGDKRAIVAIHRLGIAEVNGKIACLEQVLATLLPIYGIADLRAKVCAEPQADRAVTTCFSCMACEVLEKDVKAGLASYVENLRQESGALLIRSNDLSAVA